MGWGLLEPHRLGWGHMPPLFLLYLLSNYNQTWHDGTLGKHLSKAIKSLLRSSLGGKYGVITLFFGIVPGQNLSFLIFCTMELKFGKGSNSEALIQKSSQKVQYRYILKEKNAIFYEKLKFLAKRSLTKVCPWQHPRSLLTENYFKRCLYNYTKSPKVSSV